MQPPQSKVTASTSEISELDSARSNVIPRITSELPACEHRKMLPAGVDFGVRRSIHMQSGDSVRRIRTPKEQKAMMMRFLSIYKHAESGVPPTPEEMARMGRMVEEGMKAGWLLSTEGCLPTALGAKVTRSDGNIKVTDGPFAETREVVGGFAILKANSKAEAIELARQFLQVAGEGECELRQLYEAEACPEAAAQGQSAGGK